MVRHFDAHLHPFQTAIGSMRVPPRSRFYAASFGPGTSLGLDKATCAAYIEGCRASIKSIVRGQ
jgi:hypothetical protein